MGRAALLAIAALGLVVAPVEAAAQAAFQAADPFFRQRGQAVRDRAQPAYDALGLRAGAFTLWPSVQATATHDDNVFAAEADARAAVSLRLTPEITARSDWNRHRIEAYARLDMNRSLDLASENTADWRLGGAGRLDVTRDTHLAVDVDLEQGHEARTAAGADPLTVRPVAFDSAAARLTAQTTYGRLRLAAHAGMRRIDYRDDVDAAGGPVEQDDRDRTTLSLSGRADYAVSPAASVFLQIAGDDRDYRRVDGRPYRSSTGRETLTGVDFERGGLIRGEIAAGYRRQMFEDPAFGDLEGFSGRARLTWFPTALTTVSAAAARAVADTGVAGAAGARRSDLSLVVDHELLRNLILTARIDHVEDAYVGRDRTDRRRGARLAADYRLNRRHGLTAELSLMDQASDGAARGPRYQAVRMTVGAVARF